MGRAIIRKVFWNQAGFGGLIVGGVLTLTTLTQYLLRGNPEASGIINNILFLIAFIFVPYILGKRFSMKNALWGLTFQRALGYMFVMYLLSGFIYGVSTYIIYNLDMDYYVSECQKSMSGMGIDTMDAERIQNMIKDPMQMAFSFMFSLPFLASLPAFIISAIIKRTPAIKN